MMTSDFILIACSLGLGAAVLFYFSSAGTRTPNWIRGGLLAISGLASTCLSSWAFFQISMMAIVLVVLSFWACLTGISMAWNDLTDRD